MNQSTSSSSGLHVAIIMDGNGRWATGRGWSRSAGHRAGAEAVRRVAKAAPELGIGVLTLYAFSADNWQRPAREVETLMNLFRRFLRRETGECTRNGVRLNVIGRRDRLAPVLLTAIRDAELATRGGSRLLLRIAVDYSSRDSIVAAARLGAASRAELDRNLERVNHSVPDIPAVDLLIRTGRELRLSDFLLWEIAYAELSFSDVMWPDYDAERLGQAVHEYHRRSRRFGALDLGRAG